jgi:hypothetical protein
MSVDLEGWLTPVDLEVTSWEREAEGDSSHADSIEHHHHLHAAYFLPLCRGGHIAGASLLG